VIVTKRSFFALSGDDVRQGSQGGEFKNFGGAVQFQVGWAAGALGYLFQTVHLFIST
jgi:hypothetical protein